MLPTILLLADSNYLRSNDLRLFLKKSSENAIVLDHLVLFEMFKNNPLLTSQQSLQIASEFINQIYVIKPTHRWLNTVISNNSDLEKLIDPEATKALRDLCADLFVTPLPNNIMSQLAAREAEAKDYITRLSDEIREYEDTLKEKAASFSASQLTEIRTGNGVSDDTREKISTLLHEITGHFILSFQEPNRTEPISMATVKNMFAFRYALCVVLFFLDWVRQGKNPKKLTKRLNDIFDIQIATVSTFFSGVASNDTLTCAISKDAAAMLLKWDAFIRLVDD